MTRFNKVLHRGLLVAVAVAGVILPAANTAEAAKPTPKKLAALQQHHQLQVPIGYVNVWGNSPYYGYYNPWLSVDPTVGFPYSGGPYYYENPAFGLYGNPGYVSPGWGMDVLY